MMLQTNVSQRGVWALLLLVVAALGVAMLVRGQGASLLGRRAPAAVVKSDARSLSRLGDYGRAPEFDLIRQDGTPFRHTDLRGKLWIGDFIFTSCASTCPIMTRQMQLLAEAVKSIDGIEFVSFSVNPETDTPEVLTTYARDYGIDTTNWHFLTGDKQPLRDLVLHGFRLSVQEASREDLLAGAEAVIHSTRFVLVDEAGVIRGYYDGTDEQAMQQLLADLVVLSETTARESSPTITP
jgi:protein SCO1/2